MANGPLIRKGHLKLIEYFWGIHMPWSMLILEIEYHRLMVNI